MRVLYYKEGYKFKDPSNILPLVVQISMTDLIWNFECICFTGNALCGNVM